MNGATLRFWEAQYNLSIFSNMFNSPCGWSAWKLYGAWNLYRLTGKKEYFYMSLNCIRACLQLIDDETGKLRWGFTPDPYVITEAFVPDNGGEVETVRISEQYLEMTSTWHRTVPFPRPKWGIDNLVHEIFKAYSEIYLPHAVVLEDDGLVCMNCRAERGGDGAIRIRNIGPCVKTVIVDLDREESVIIDGVPHAMRKCEISMGGQTP